MVTYIYNVDANGFLKTIQQALDQIYAELQTSPTVTDDIQILVSPGIYPAFTIPSGCTLPLITSIYRLVIKSAGDYFPIIDQTETPSGTYVGADIGSANPQVTIQGLRFQHFSVGIRASLNSHNLLINKCIVANNRNVGILIDQCKQVAILQNIITNGDYGLVVKLCKDIAVLHNTIYIDGSYSSQEGIANAAAWLQLANEYTNGINDTGKLYLAGNILWNRVGNSLALFKDDINRSGCVISNFNDIVKGAKDLIALYDRVHVADQVTVPTLIPNLLDWKQRTGRDLRSKSQDPKFIQPVRSSRIRNGNFLDLSLLPLSPILGMVPSFFSDTSSAAIYLPSYVDSSLLAKDILGNDRRFVTTAAGANERASSAGFFGQDIFIGPDTISLSKQCNLNPIHDIVFKDLDVWFPSLEPGYFYSRERQYYLYAKKVGRHLGECAVTEFQLPANVVTSKPIKISAAGKLLNDPRYIDIRGDKVILYHYDLPIADGNEEFEIECSIRAWSNNGFVYNQTHYRFRINEGKTRFLLPQDFEPGGPIVITDDRVALTDDDRLANREFSLAWDVEEQREEIVFAQNSNRILNAQFDIPTTGMNPRYWSSSGNAQVVIGYAPRFTVMGDNFLDLSGAGFIEQTVQLTSGSHAFSWHACAPTGTISGAFYNLEFLNADYEPLGFIISGEYSPASNWTRYYVGIGDQDNYPHLTPVVNTPVSGLNSGSYAIFPPESIYANLRLGITGDGRIWFDAIQFEQNVRPTVYHRKPFFDEITVEYESYTGNFIDSRMAISSSRNLLSQGFLYIPEIPSSIYGGPPNMFITTLHEWRWPMGRKYVMPWSRTSGKDKLKYMPDGFSLVPKKHNPIITPVHGTPTPDVMKISPDIPVIRQGDTNGIGINIQVIDSYGNPYGLEYATISIFDKMLRFPGYLHKKFYGIKEQLSTTVFGPLDNAGTIQVYWIPPDEYSVAYIGKVPKPTRSSNGERLSSIETNYAVNSDLHGNVIILDSSQNVLATKSSSSIKSVYVPKYSKDHSIITLDYPPVYGSVKILIDGEFYSQTDVNPPASNQFYVDYTEFRIVVKGRKESIYVEYNPSFAYINSNDPYRINFFHDRIFGSYSGPILVGYDAMLTLNVEVPLADRSTSIIRKFPLVAQNFLISNKLAINSDALDY